MRHLFRAGTSTIRRRLLFANVLTGVLLLLASMIVIWQTNRLGTAVATLEQATKQVTAALEARQHSTFLIATVTRLLPLEDAILFETDVVGALDDLRNSYEELSLLAAESEDGSDLSRLTNQSLLRLESVIGVAETMVRQAQSDQWPSVRVRVGVLNRDQQQLVSDTNNLIALSQEIEAEAVAQVTAARRAVILYPGLVIGLAILLGGVLSWQTVTSIARPVEQLTLGAERISARQMEGRIPVERSDELGQLAEAFNLMADRIQAFQEELEQRVQDRTAELAQRVEQLNLINQVARESSTLLPRDELMEKSTRRIRALFDYYAVLIGLVSAETNEMFLKAGDSADRLPLPTSDSLRIPISQKSIVTHAAQTRRPVAITDVNNHPLYMPLDALPQTRSELALPLMVGETVLGVLDLQSNQVGEFDDDDVRVLQTLADQIAIAIRNAQLFQQAQTARAEAEEANRLKSQFLANMSHELRTPLNSIINFAYLLVVGAEGDLQPGQVDMLQRIQDAGQHLLGLINDILDLAKIEAGRLEIFFQEVDLHTLVDGVAATAVGLLRDKPVELRRELPDDLPAAHVDGARVRQVLLNLLSNAAKFTEEGEIRIGADADAEWITVSVSDTGAGIPPEDLDRIFTEFVQGEGISAHRMGGTGLGLSISQQLVDLHGGRIWAESVVGEGSTFYFTLPRCNTTGTAVSIVVEKALDG